MLSYMLSSTTNTLIKNSHYGSTTRVTMSSSPYFLFPNLKSLWTQGAYVFVKEVSVSADRMYLPLIIDILCILFYDIETSSWSFNLLQGKEYNIRETDPGVPSVKATFTIDEIPEEYVDVANYLMALHKKEEWPEPLFLRIY